MMSPMKYIDDSKLTNSTNIKKITYFTCNITNIFAFWLENKGYDADFLTHFDV